MDKRLVIVFCTFSAVVMLLFLKVGSISTNEFLAKTATAQSRYTLTFGETRNMIYDCKMVPLVENEDSYVAACLPLPENMAALLHCNELSGDILSLMESGRPFIASCTSSALDIKGVKVVSVKKRNGANQLARHIIGYVDSNGDGVTGIEKSYNEFLKDSVRSSSISYQVDGMRNPLVGIEPKVSLAPAATKGVVLTIDSRIQKITEDIGRKHLKKGAVIVMEPSTGKLKAVASFPQYDLTNLSKAIKDSENTPMINRAFCAYSVGSTFKIVTAATALSQHISPNIVFDCSGTVKVLDQEFKCHEEKGHGRLNLKQAMEVSCNPYFIQLGLKLDITNFLNMAHDLSFSRASRFADGISTASGVLPSKKDLLNPAAVANFSFGQGNLTATPVQIAQMVSSVVNGGGTPSANLIEGITQNGKYVENKNMISLPVKAMNEEVANTIKDCLVGCVSEEPNQKAKPIYVSAGGKTGTAQTGRIKENDEELLEGWFAGFFPAEEPEYVVVVLAEDARSGNQDASPVFREIADALYNPVGLKIH